MKRVWGLVALVLVLGLAVMVAGAGKERSIVAVFDIQTKFLKLSSAKRGMLTELLGQELGVDGIYQVMPPGDVKRALLEQSAESYKECYDEKCQVQLGRQLPVNKLVTTTIMKTAGKCRVMASLYDLRRQTTDIVAKAKCACTEEGFVPAIEKVAAKLRAFGTGSNLGFVEEDLGEKPGGDWDTGAGQEVIVSFTSEPPGAVVLVDGSILCRETPCSKSLKKGSRLVAMKAERHLERKERLLVAEGSALAWKLTPNFGWLSVRSEPSGLEATVNGIAAGRTPIERVEQEPGVYRVMVKSPCHYDVGKKVKIGRGEAEIVSVALKEKQGAVKVSAKDKKGNDIAAEVYVDGRKIGSAPGTFKVSVCAKELEVRHRKHGSAKKGLSIIERKLSLVDVKLQGGGGLQWVYSPPAGIEFTKSEVTVAQYRACVKAGKCSKPKTKSENKYCNWGYSNRDKHPVNCVDWNQAKSFCEWAGGRLPTEKEWEAEASNKGSRKYPWGEEEVSCDRAIWGDGKNTDGCGRDSTWPVCSKARGNSVSGLCDMGGNLWEWTSSWYDNTQKARVVRGGSWDCVNTENFRASVRDRGNPTVRHGLIGLRCGRVSQ